jgi:hypothetical protein
MIYQVVLSAKKTVSAQLRAGLIHRVGKIEGHKKFRIGMTCPIKSYRNESYENL